MLLSAVSVLVVAQSSSEFPEGLMNNPVYKDPLIIHTVYFSVAFIFTPTIPLPCLHVWTAAPRNIFS